MAGGHYEKDMFRQLQETISRLDTFEERYHTDIRELKRTHRLEIAHIEEKHQTKEQALKQVIGLQEQTIAKQTREIDQLKEKNELLLEDVDRLKSIINNDSNNSSQPPSTDQKGGKPANRHNGREKSGRSKGAQPGHQGKTLTKAEVEGHINAGHYKHEVVEHGEKSGKPIVKYELDMHVEVHATEHRFYPDAQGKYHIPREFSGDVVYGARLKVLTVFLYSVGVVSTERIGEIVNGLSGDSIKVSQGSIYGFIRRFSDKLDGEIGYIAKQLLVQRVLHTDGTNINVDGKQQYIRNTSCPSGVLYEPMEKKSLECLRQLSVLPKCTATLVHDHETTLYRFGTKHAECNVHLLRYLRKNTEDTGHLWSVEMSKLLCAANRERTERKRAGQPFSEEERRRYEEEYDRLCSKGMEENQGCKPRWAQKDELALLRRLKKYKSNHLLFLSRFDVAFENNMSERDLRKCKTRQKMSGGFRTHRGMGMYCRILSFIETCKRRSIGLFGALFAVLRGKSVLGTAEQ